MLNGVKLIVVRKINRINLLRSKQITINMTEGIRQWLDDQPLLVSLHPTFLKARRVECDE